MKIKQFAVGCLVALLGASTASEVFAASEVISAEIFNDVETDWIEAVTGSADANFSVINKHLRVEVLTTGDLCEDVIYYLPNQPTQGGLLEFYFSAWSDTVGAEVKVIFFDEEEADIVYSHTYMLTTESAYYRFFSEPADYVWGDSVKIQFCFGGGVPSVIHIDDIVYAFELDPWNWNIDTIISLRGLEPTYESMAKASEVVAVAKRNRAKLAIGIQGRDLIDDGSPEKNAFFTYLADLAADSDIELWNNGWNGFRSGAQTEYDGTPKKHQRESILDTNTLAKAKLGLEFKTFGAPYARNDKTTCDVIEQFSTMPIMLLPQECDDNGDYEIRLTNKIGIGELQNEVDFGYFLTQYFDTVHHTPDHIVIDGDMSNWTSREVMEFEKILDFIVPVYGSDTPYGHYLKFH
ncbi:hypothetical protein [Teredinibacter turnerae]|uniref:hypothetical protein n=1 Tax=Teredinibacter turnerae TaxID=2426 RepID=UPI0003F704EE|nr:hypothetical protein [Teredinibacter turnerae]